MTTPPPTNAALTAPETVKCPICDADIVLPVGTVVGEIVTCEDCAAELEVASLTPVTLVEAPETEEDWGE